MLDFNVSSKKLGMAKLRGEIQGKLVVKNKVQGCIIDMKGESRRLAGSASELMSAMLLWFVDEACIAVIKEPALQWQT